MTPKALRPALALVAAPLLGLLAGAARADSPHTIERLAQRLERQADRLLDEARDGCRHTPQYRHLERDVAELERITDHVRREAHRGDLGDLRADVRRAHGLQHHIAGLVEELAHRGQVDRRTLARLRDTLGDMGQTLHQLEAELYHLGRPHRW